MPKILIADDADIGRSILKTLLKREFDVVEARNGLEVIRLLQSDAESIDVMTLDYMMPVMDGLKVMAFMSENNLLTRIPVLMLTAVSDPDGIVRCLEAGATDVVEKPYEPRVLLAKIRAAMQRMASIRADAAAYAPAANPSEGDLYEAVLDAIPQAVFIEDPKTRTILYANASFRSFHYMVPNPVGYPHTDLIPPESAKAVNDAVDKLLSFQAPPPVSVLGPDGDRYLVLFNALLDDSGSISHVIGSITRQSILQ